MGLHAKEENLILSLFFKKFKALVEKKKGKLSV